ncbi:MAG: GlxA family transcriptional regulator [Sneathiellales bacterium]|nr:GlxA family transcriptional regulator [Sneathiellales bacterium]
MTYIPRFMPNEDPVMTVQSPPPSRRVVLFTYPGVKLLDVTGPFQVFSDARLVPNSSPLYRPQLASVKGGPVKTDTAITLETKSLEEALQGSLDLFLVAGGEGVDNAARNEEMIRAVSRLAAKARRMASVCSGALLLAETGLLEGRRVTTHWGRCDQFRKKHPDIKLEGAPIYIKDGPVWTSAGVTAGIDMALAIVKEDYGAKTALALARQLVVYMARPGGQSQFSTVLKQQSEDTEDRFGRLHDWIRDNLSADLRVERLADFMNMSNRSFSRIYKGKTGSTPAKAVEALRIEAARNFLEETSIPISLLAARCGFADDERLRRAFTRRLGVSPNDYRKRFSTVS